MDDVTRLLDVIGEKLHQSGHSQLLKTLLDSYLEGGIAAVEAKVKEILNEIEEG